MLKIFFSAMLILVLASGYYTGWNQALGLSLGITWGFLNLFFIKQLAQSVLIAEKRNVFALLTFSLLKFPLLYFLGYQLLVIPYFSPWSLLIGFSLTLIISTQSWFWNLPLNQNSSSSNPT